MFTGGLDATYRNALASSHTPVTYVDVYDGDALILADLPIINGNVSANLTSRVSRNSSLTVHENYYPVNDDDLLSPFRSNIRIRRGIRLGDGLEIMFPVFRGKITDADLGPDGTVDITASDRAYDVDEAKFVVPENSSVGVTVDTEIKRLISDGVVNAQFGSSDTYSQRVPPLTWESDRAAAADELAKAVGSFWYALADGKYVIRRIPWTMPGDPVVTLSDKDDGDGIVKIALPSKSRSSVFNSITAISERTDGSTPSYAIVEDINPQSATYVGGSFGRRHKLLRLQSPSSQGDVLSAARAYLRHTTARGETWTWTQIPDPAMELGDIVRLNVRGRKDIIQVVSGFTMPLVGSDLMRVTGRSQIIGLLDG